MVVHCIDVDNDIFMIQSSGIHLILKQFITRTPEGLLLEKKTELHDRANSILNRWEDRLIQDIPNRQWGPAPNNSLVYVSMKDGASLLDFCL